MTQAEFEILLLKQGYNYKPTEADLELALTGLQKRLKQEVFSSTLAYAHHEHSHRLTPPVNTFCTKLYQLMLSEEADRQSNKQQDYEDLYELINKRK